MSPVFERHTVDECLAVQNCPPPAECMHRQPAEMVSAGCKMLKAISIIPAVCSVCACSHCWKLPPDPPVQGLNVACLAAGTWEIHIAWVCSRHLILHQPAAWTCLRPEDQVNAHQSQSPGLLQQNNLFMALGVLPWVPDCLLGQARSQPHSPAGGGGSLILSLLACCLPFAKDLHGLSGG